jgi:hypothetical protein
MESGSVVQIRELRSVINGILDFIEKDLKLREVELGKDHYWEVLDRDLFSMERPTELGAGSLIDDLEFLLSSAKDKTQQIPIMLIHVAPLLKALSQAVPSYTSPERSSGG